MKRSSRAKPEVIDISSDDDSPIKQPPPKAVKKDAKQFLSPTAFDSRMKEVKLEEDYQGACRKAAESRRRVAYLEELLDKKDKERDSSEEEKKKLKKKLTETEAKLENASKNGEDMMKKDCEKTQEIIQLKFDVVELKRTMASMHTDEQLMDRANLMTAELTDKLQKADENRKKDFERIVELNRKLAEVDGTAHERLQAQLQSQKNLVEDLQKKIAESSAELEKEKIEAAKKLAEVEDTARKKLQSQSKFVEDLQKKIAENSVELEKEKSEATNREEQAKRLEKLEKDYQGVCRIANEYEKRMNEAMARVMELEDIIDKKPMIPPVDDTDKRLIAELETMLAETSTQLENVRSDAVRGEQQLQDRIGSLTRRLEAEQARLREEREKNGEMRIELERLKNAEGGAMQPSRDLVLMPKKPLATVVSPKPTLRGPSVLLGSSSESPARLKKTPGKAAMMSPNLCEPCTPSETNGSIFFLNALKQLHSRYHPRDNEWLWKCRNAIFSESHQCTACNKRSLIGDAILSHFFSKGHINKMRECNARLALATFEYWLAKLESIPKPATVPLPAPNVTVSPPNVTVTPPNVTVTSPNVTVTPTVNDVKPETTKKTVITAVATKITVTGAAPKPVVAKKKMGRPRKADKILETPPPTPANDVTEASRQLSIAEEIKLRRKHSANDTTEATEATEASRDVSIAETKLRRSLRNARSPAVAPVAPKTPRVTPKVKDEPPTHKVAVRRVTTTGTPATKVQVATVAPRVSSPKAGGGLRPVKQEEEDGNANRCSLM